MKFWQWLARLCTAVFLLLLLGSWLANGHHSSTASPELQDEPPPAPKFH